MLIRAPGRRTKGQLVATVKTCSLAPSMVMMMKMMIIIISISIITFFIRPVPLY